MKMEVFSVGSTAFVVVLVLMVAWAWKAVNWVWLRPKKLERYLRQQGLTGNSYKLLFGDLKESNMLKKEAHSTPIDLSADIVPRLVPFVHQAVDKYGKNCFIWQGPLPTVIIMDPELIKEILSKFNVFQKPKTTTLAELLVTGLVQHEGEKWAKHRGLLNPAYRLEKLKHMSNAFYLSCEEMMSEWEVLALTKGSLELDMWHYFHKLSCNMLARAAFGNSYEQGKKIFLLQQEQVDIALQVMRSVYIYIPRYRFLPTKFNRRLKQIEKDMGTMFKEIIKKREETMKRGESNDDDLLGAYMTLNFKEIQEHGNKKEAGLSIDEMIDECKASYLAGENATSVLLTWTIVLLSKHQNWQTQAREEVLQIFGNSKPDFDGLNRLKIVTMILHEVLRLYPPAFYTHRMVYEETKLGKLSVPPGVLIQLPILLIHHDHELWGDDVKEFKPERFSHGVAKATKGQLSFFPFSSGPRTCIGQNFAMIEAKMALSMILQRFWFELSSSYTHAPFPSITLQPQHGAHIILHKI